MLTSLLTASNRVAWACVCSLRLIYIFGLIVVLLVVLIFLPFSSVAMFVSTTVSFSVIVVRVTSERIKVRARMVTEEITDLLLDINVEAL